MTRWFSIIPVLALLTGCAKQPTIKSGVDLEQLIKGKSRTTADRQEALPNTYYELTAWTGMMEKHLRRSLRLRAR